MNPLTTAPINRESETLLEVGGEPFRVDVLIAPGDIPEHTAPSGGSLTEVAVRSLPRRIKGVPRPQVQAKHRSFREAASWEGVVIARADEGIVAKLTRRYQDFPAEEASIPWMEIDEADQPLAVEGALFSWKVGYLESNGQRLSVSKIEFRRTPNFSARERRAAEAKADEYAALFNG